MDGSDRLRVFDIGFANLQIFHNQIMKLILRVARAF
jgi:hypothetical protein